MPPSLNFPQLDFVKPSSGFHPVTWERVIGSPEIKSHTNVGAVERRREYHMGEGGGFPQVRAVVSFVSPESPVVYLSTKGAPERELTNLLVGYRFK
jgi:hypothetical protein